MRSLTEHHESDDALIAQHIALPATRPDGRALVRLNMISSADGGTEIEGQSGGLGNRNDHAVFAALRAESDAVLVGMHTVVADHYGPPSVPGLQIFVISGKPDVSGNEKLFASGRATLVLPEDAPPAPDGVPELRAGTGGRVDLAAVATQLAGSVVLMEGGPRLAGEMMALGLIDEFFLTVSPMVLAGESSRDARTAGGPDAMGSDARILRRRRLSVPSLRARMTSDEQGVGTMGRKYQIISGDGHLETPPDFVKFVPEKWKDRAPRLITLPDGGGDAWLMEGMPLTYASQNLKGRGVVKFAGQSYFNDDGSRAEGTGDGVQRLREQDEDGIDAEILFAPVFASRFLEKIPDRDVYMAMVQAYNTWLSEDYSAPAPDRLIVNALMPISGIDDAVAELERAHTMGFKTVQMVQYPNGGSGPKPEDDRFWERSLELGMALSPHFSFGGPINIGGARHDTSQWPAEAGMTQHAQGPPSNSMAQMIVHGVFDRIPELRFYFAEINAALFPAHLYYMDRDYLEYNSWFQLELPKMPSEYMRTHARYGMVREPLAVRMGQEMPDDMPLDLFLWGSDFPHSVGTFPRSQDYIKETFADLDDDLRRKLLAGNAADHLGLDLDADITETPVAA